MLGIIGGTRLQEGGLLGKVEEVDVETSYGLVKAFRGHGFIYINRHGVDKKKPAHAVNHYANISAFKEQHVKDVVAVSSVGSLKTDIPVGCIVVPHDFIQLTNIPTFHKTDLFHVTPKLDEGLRKTILKTAERLSLKVVSEAVYFQSPGPRLETRAEVNFFKDYADVVGMTMASEATLACELGIRYADISIVDNYAHGIANTVPDYRRIRETASHVRDDLLKLLHGVVEVYR